MGAGVVYAEGPPPQFAVYEREDSVKLVVSLFNLTIEIEETGKGFMMHLTPDHQKQAKASLFRSTFGESRNGDIVPGQTAKLEVVLGSAFAQQKIEVIETKTRLKVILPKLTAPKIGMTMHRVRGD